MPEELVLDVPPRFQLADQDLDSGEVKGRSMSRAVEVAAGGHNIFHLCTYSPVPPQRSQNQFKDPANIENIVILF